MFKDWEDGMAVETGSSVWLCGHSGETFIPLACFSSLTIDRLLFSHS